MGRGRKPTPTAIKEARGSYINHPERRTPDEPAPTSGAPDKPEVVKQDKFASVFWDQTCKLLDDMGVLTHADLQVLQLYCENESLLEQCRTQLEVMDWQGSKRSPGLMQWNACIDRKMKLMAELGLTPSSRTKLRVVKPAEADPFLEFLEMAKGNGN